MTLKTHFNVTGKYRNYKRHVHIKNTKHANFAQVSFCPCIRHNQQYQSNKRKTAQTNQCRL